MHANPEWMSTHQGATLVEDLDILLRDLCVGWGWCNHTVFGETLLRGKGCVTGEAVARAVLEAERVDPDANGDRICAIARFFQYRYGRAAVSEADYVPGESPPYTVPPTSPHPAADVPPGPALIEAREAWRLALDEATGAAEPREAAAAADPDARATKLREISTAIGAARRASAIALGPEKALAHADLWALFLLHERLTGEFMIDDPDARKIRGFGGIAGKLAAPAPSQERL